MGRTLWGIARDVDHGWLATEFTRGPEGDPETATGRTIGPHRYRPDLEAELLKAGVGFADQFEQTQED